MIVNTPANRSSVEKEGLSILVVDDNVFFCSLAAQWLEIMDEVSSVATENNALNVLERVQVEHFNVVLLDIAMPKRNGLDLLQDLMAIPRSPRVVMVTGQGEDAYRLRAMELGAFAYVQKSTFVQHIPAVLRACHDALPG